MNILPLIERELRVRARSRGTYWARFAVGLVGALICLPQLISPSLSGTTASLGKGVFDATVGGAFLLACSSCLLTADAISAERREGTLGLLFLTRVRGFDVLFGKLGSCGLAVLCALVVLMPMLMIPVLAGGVTGGEAFRNGLALVNTLFFALSAGLWASATQKERSRAFTLAVSVVLLISLVPAIVARVPAGFGLLSPFITLISAGDVHYRTSATPYWSSLIAVQVIAWLLLVWAGIRLHGAVRDEPTHESFVRPLASARLFASSQRRRRKLIVDQAGPVGWLVRRQRGIKTLIWAATLLGVLSSLGILFFYRYIRLAASGSVGAIMNWSSLVVSLITASLFALAFSRFFVEARRMGELELLLTTPLGAKRIVSEQWDALRRLLRWPVLIMVAGSFMPSFWRLILGPGVLWYAPGLFLIALSLASTLLGLGAMCWSGIWFGLRSRNPANAVLWTVCVAKGVPVIINLVWRPLLGIVLFGPGRSLVLGWPLFLWWPHLMVLAFDVWLIRWARRRILSELSGADLISFNLRHSFSAATRQSAAAILSARRWRTS